MLLSQSMRGSDLEMNVLSEQEVEAMTLPCEREQGACEHGAWSL